MTISVIIPVYNEEKAILSCLESLQMQTLHAEIIIVDDGSKDNSKLKIPTFAASSSQRLWRVGDKATGYKQNPELILLEQTHKGSGSARNLGASKAKGEILVFIDADMTFTPDFLEKLVKPIVDDETKGTFTKEEYVSNWEHVWARCWNYNQGLVTNHRIPPDYPEESPVFRAILKTEFDRVAGFDSIGFTDDWTLSRKLGYKASRANGAICFHQNPETLSEIYLQARWIGKSEFLTKSLERRFFHLILKSLPLSIFSGLFLALRYREFHMMIFKPIYDLGVFISIILSFFGEPKYK